MTAILGGGIIGLSTAYYLSETHPDIHIIDSASKLLTSASAYAGGFLARDWFSPESSSLGALSFDLHKSLAEQHNGSERWSYMPSTAYSLSDTQGRGHKWLEDDASRAEAAPGEMLNADGTPAWFMTGGGKLSVIDEGCAQVNPKRLCEFLIEECERRGVKIHVGCTARVDGPRVLVSGNEELELECDNLVIAAGAWTPIVAAELFPGVRVPVEPLAGYSVVVRSPRYSKPITSGGGAAGVSHAVYAASGGKWDFSPETFSRVDNGRPEIWVGGLNDGALRLPETANGVQELIDVKKSRKLRDAVVAMTGVSNDGDDLDKGDLEIVREGLCFRPVSRTGVPILCQVEKKKLGDAGASLKVFVASGHGPWGISLSLGSGKVMAELIIGKQCSAHISELEF